MIQKHTILLNPRFSTGSTTPEVITGSDLQNINGYEVNNLQGLGGGVVSQYNVRGFLRNDSNNRIINDFFSYLTASTTTVEFGEIWSSDAKISQVFNDYYNSSVLNNQIPSTEAITGVLTGTSGTTIVENSIYNYDGISPSKYLENIPQSINQGSRILRVYSALTTFTTDESYYIPVRITRRSGMISRQQFFFDNIELLLNEMPDSGSPDSPGLPNLPGIDLPAEPIGEPIDSGDSNEDPVFDTNEPSEPISEPIDSGGSAEDPVFGTNESFEPITEFEEPLNDTEDGEEPIQNIN